MKTKRAALKTNTIFLLTVSTLLLVALTSPASSKSPDEHPVYIVAIDAEYAPYEFVGPDGKPIGFTVSLLNAIGNLAGVTFRFVPMNWPDAVAGLDDGTVDLVNMIQTPDRAAMYEFSEPYGQIVQAIFTTAHTNISGLESLSGHTVALQANNISLEILASRSDINKVIVHSKEEGMLLLNAGGVDAFLAAEQAGVWMLQENGLENIQIADTGLFSRQYGFAARKGNTALISLLNSNLDTLKSTGEYGVLVERWLTFHSVKPSWLARHQETIIFGLPVLIAALIGFVSWNLALRSAVARRTEDLRVSEERFRKSFYISPDSVNLNRLSDGMYVSINQGFTQIMGYTADEIIGKTSLETSIWANPKDRIRLVAGLRKNGEIVNFEAPFRAKNGEIRVGLMSAAVVELDDVPHIISITRDITARKEMETAIRQRLRFAQGLNEIAEVIIAHDVPDTILEETARIVGETLNVDRALIYDVSFEKNQAIGLCEWLNPAHPDIEPTKATYPLDVFIGGATEMRRKRHWLESHADAINPHFLEYGSAQALHQQMNIQSLLWYPFAFYEGGYYALVLNQVRFRRAWTEEELEFVDSISKQQSIALTKTRLLKERRRHERFITRLNDITRAANVLDFYEMLRTLADRLGELLESDGCYITLWDDARQQTIPAAACGELRETYPHSPTMPGHTTMTESVLNAGHALVANDVFHSPYLSPQIAREYPARSMLGLPLISSGERIGAALIAWNTPHAVTPEEIERGEQAADQIALAVYKSRLLAETRRNLNELEILFENGQKLNTTLNARQIAQYLVDIIRQRLEWHHIVVRRYFPQNQTFELLAFTSPDAVNEKNRAQVEQRFREKVSSGHHGLSGWAVQKRHSLRVSSLAADSHYTETYPGLLSGLYVPIKHGEKILGVISVESEQADAFSGNDQRFLETLAGQTAAAFENARLFDEALQRADRMATLHQISSAITSSMDLSVTLKFLLEQTTAQLGVDAAAIMLIDPIESVLEFAAGSGFHTAALQHTRRRLGDGAAGRAVMNREIIHIADLQKEQESFSASNLLGLEAFVAYFAVPLISKAQTIGVLEIFHRAPLNATDELVDFLEMVAKQAAIAIDDAHLFTRLHRANVELLDAYDATIEGWSHALDLRDKETEGHTVRVMELTIQLARMIGISDADLVHIRRGAMLHDIGKIGVPDSILHKPGPLTVQELEIMRQHPQFAYEMLSPIAYLRLALEIPYCHHEKWDGTGYPRGLEGEQIPVAARLFAVVDVWDALTSDRPYRKAWTHKKAIEYIREQSGLHFDPKAVGLFLKVIKEDTKSAG